MRIASSDSRFMQVGVEVPWQRIVENWPEDLREAFEERAAIMQFDGEMPRQEAERRAFTVIRDTQDAARMMWEDDR